MFEFFDLILGFIETLWGFVISFIDSLFFALTVLARGTTIWTVLIGYVPAVLGAAISIFMACYIVKFFVGR